MKLIKKMSMSVAAATLGAAALTGAAAPAVAAPSTPTVSKPLSVNGTLALDCSANFCFWWNAIYEGRKDSFTYSSTYVGDSRNDVASSVHNRTARRISLFGGLNYTDAQLYVYAGETVDQLSAYQYGSNEFRTWNDKLSSFRL